MPPLTHAMLLAAGLSTRMRPLTDHLPKPLLPFWDRTILDFTLEYLRYNGVKSLAVNLHYHREALRTALSKEKEMKVSLFEEDPILDTGGGIKNMRSSVKEKVFAVMNCDLLTDVDLREVVEFHQRKKALATLVIFPRDDAKLYGEVGLDREGRVVSFPHCKKNGEATVSGMFGGIHILDRAIFDEMPEEKIFSITKDVYAKLVTKGAPIYGYVSRGRWYDLGEPDLYRRSQLELKLFPLPWIKMG